MPNDKQRRRPPDLAEAGIFGIWQRRKQKNSPTPSVPFGAQTPVMKVLYRRPPSGLLRFCAEVTPTTGPDPPISALDPQSTMKEGGANRRSRKQCMCSSMNYLSDKGTSPCDSTLDQGSTTSPHGSATSRLRERPRPYSRAMAIELSFLSS